jgi:tetratricopeptide (TPR) repeat protein
MFGASSLSLTWLLIAFLGVNPGVLFLSPQAQPPRPTELSENDPLSYAVAYARKSNNQFALSEIAVHYAELGDFEQALRVNESATDEDWRTRAFGKIALEYWKHGQKEKARELFLRVANLPLPKDYIYIWGDIIENMAEAQQFELALETDNAMAAAGGTTAGYELAKIVEHFIEAKAHNASLPDILPRVISIAKTLPDTNNTSAAIKKVAVAYAAQGQYDRAIKLIQQFDEDFDREDGAQGVAVQFAKLGLYDRAVELADKAGNYFGPIALVEVASEALKRRDKAKALEITGRADSLIAKANKDEDYEPSETEATRLSELAVLYSQLDRKSRAIELAGLAFKTAKEVGKPGERYGALRSAANTYCELGLYDKAIDAAKALGDYDRIQFDVLAEVGEHAQRKGRVDAVENIVKTIQAAKLKETQELRIKAMLTIARAGAERGRTAEAQKLLLNTAPLTERLEWTENTGNILKNFAVAFAEAGNIRAALKHLPTIEQPYFITHALIDIGTLCAKKGLTLDEGDVTLLNEIVKADLPPDIQPERLVNEKGWEIPGLAQARMLRPPELQRTRDLSVQLYFTYYEPEVATLIERPFPPRRKPKPEEAEWASEGLKAGLIEERVINGHKFCYRLTFEEIFHDKVTGLPRYTNHIETLLYYDEDGDGRFETLEEGLDYFARGHIPKWVLEK